MTIFSNIAILGFGSKGVGASMRVVRVKFAMLVCVAFLLGWCIHVWLPPWNHVPTLEELQKLENMEQVCRHPDLDPNNPLLTKHIRDLGELECKRELDWVETKNGMVYINSIIGKRHGRISCTLTYLRRVDDFSSVKDKQVSLTSDGGAAKLESDFFNVHCESQDGLTWKNIMAGVSRNETAVKEARRNPPPDGATKLNVLIFGLDSMSRLHYIRKLPKTYRYLTQVLNATVLKGYNIVGDGTPQALIPILTGSTELELPETRKRMSNANFVNVYPFAWKNFSANGYITAFGEDCPSTGIFTYRLKGFDDIPTHHYMRSFYVEADKVIRKHPKYCLGNTPRHKVMLNWLRQFYDVYSDVPKFAFLFHGELSHDDYNIVGYADPDIEMFLRGLHNDGILNNTLLMLMSDHGHRFSSIRETQQGKQEERLPFFAIVVPPWMEKKYPSAVHNLWTNAERLTTPFDIYSTLLTVLYPDVPKVGDISKRTISLFSEIPQERSCVNADIEPHWCACLSWANVLLTDPIAKVVGQAVIDFINRLTDPHRDICVPLYVEQVTRVEKMQPNLALLKFKKNADHDGFVGDFSDNTKVTEVIYQVQLRAFPSMGLYEASLKHDTVKNAFHIREQDISRVNMYGNQEHCIHNTFPNLRKYCYCKIQL